MKATILSIQRAGPSIDLWLLLDDGKVQRKEPFSFPLLSTVDEVRTGVTNYVKKLAADAVTDEELQALVNEVINS